MKALSSAQSLVTVLAIAAGMAGMTGCMGPLLEGEGSSEHKLLAPHAVFKGAATAETKAELGISEWHIYRGRSRYILTAYNASGKPMKGFQMTFAGSKGSAAASLSTRFLDGTKNTATHTFGGATTASLDIGALAQQFLGAATHDMTALRLGMPTSLTTSAIPTGQACNGDMVKITMTSLQCISQAKTSGSSISQSVKIKRCTASATAARNAAISCQNTQLSAQQQQQQQTSAQQAADKAAETADKTATDPAKKTTDPSKDTDDPSIKAHQAEQAAADKKQDAAQDAADAAQEAADKKQDADQDAADNPTKTKLPTGDDVPIPPVRPSQDEIDKMTATDQANDANIGGPDATKAAKDTQCACNDPSATDIKGSDSNGAPVQLAGGTDDIPGDAPGADQADPGTGLGWYIREEEQPVEGCLEARWLRG